MIIVEPVEISSVVVDGSTYRTMATKYLSNNELALEVLVTEEGNGYEEPYGTLTVNLEDYGVVTAGGTFVVDHKMNEYSYDITKAILDDICGVDRVESPIQYGFCTSFSTGLSNESWDKIKDNFTVGSSDE